MVSPSPTDRGDEERAAAAGRRLAPSVFSGAINGTGELELANPFGIGAPPDVLSLTLTGTSAFSGTISIDATRTLQVDGSIVNSTTNVGLEGKLQGNGSTGAVNVGIGGRLSPGVPGTPGILDTDNVFFDQVSNFDVKLGGTGVFQADLLNVHGTITLFSGPHRNVSQLAGFNPAPGASFTIMQNDATDSVSGTFSGLPEGASFDVGGQRYTITYRGGGPIPGGVRNDVIITASAGRTAQFDGDRYDDVLLHNQATGALIYADMEAGVRVGYGSAVPNQRG